MPMKSQSFDNSAIMSLFITLLCRYLSLYPPLGAAPSPCRGRAASSRLRRCSTERRPESAAGFNRHAPTQPRRRRSPGPVPSLRRASPSELPRRQLPATAESYINAYRVQPEPLLLFNAAQALRKGEIFAEALTLYQRFITAAPSPRWCPRPKPTLLRCAPA